MFGFCSLKRYKYSLAKLFPYERTGFVSGGSQLGFAVDPNFFVCCVNILAAEFSYILCKDGDSHNISFFITNRTVTGEQVIPEIEQV